MFRNFILLLAAAGVMSVSGPAGAASLTYTDFVTTADNANGFPTPVATVDDRMNDGFLTFSIGSSGTTGKLSGFFFDASGKSIVEADIVSESVSIAGFASDPGKVDNLKGGANSNGGYPNGVSNPSFDIGLRIAQTDVSTTPFTFQISTAKLLLSDLAADGQGAFFRFQTVGAGGGSAKVLGYPGVTPPYPQTPSIPLPAAAWLLLAGLGGLGALRLFGRA